MPFSRPRLTTPPHIRGSGEVPRDTGRLDLVAWMEDRELSIYVLLILTGGAVYLTYLIFRPFLTALFLALVLAIAVAPLHRWLSRGISSRYLAALLTTVVAATIVLVPFILLSARLAAEAANVYSSVLQPLRNPEAWPRRLAPVLEAAADLTGIPADKLRADVSVYARQVASSSLTFAVSFGRRFAQQLATIALAFIFVLPLLRNSDEFRRGALCMLPLSRERARELALAVYEGIVADIYGVVAVGIVEGTLIAFGFWITGLRSPLFWGAIGVLLSCLPFVGVSLVWVPACVVLALRGNWTNAILLLVWCAVVVSTTEGVVRSTVVSGRTKVNSMLVMLSVMGGVAAFSAVGIFVGPVVLVLAGTLIRILREEHATSRNSVVRT